MKTCDRCTHPAVDVVGERQASLFDVAPADPRATDSARAELRAGRVLCSACQRTDDLPGMAEADAAATAQFYADQAEEDRVDAELDAARIRAAQARVDEFGCISEQDHAILIAQQAEAVKRAQGWSAAHDNDDGTERRSKLEAFPVAPAPSKPRRKRNKNWRGDANADAWERAKAGR